MSEIDYKVKYWTIEHWDSSDGYETYKYSFGQYRRKPSMNDYEIISKNDFLMSQMIFNCYLHELLENGYTGNNGFGFKIAEHEHIFKFDKLNGE